MGSGLAAINPDMGTGMDLLSAGADPGAGTTIKPPGVLGRVKNAGLDVNDDAERLELSNEETGIPGGYEHDSLAAQGTKMLEMNGDLESHGFSLKKVVNSSAACKPSTCSRWMACKLHYEPPNCDKEWTNIGTEGQAWHPSGPHLQLGDLVVG